MTMQLPDDLQNVISLADWLELTALSSADGNASRGDLERQIKKAGVVESADEDEAIDLLLDEVFKELDSRSTAITTHYPFLITNSLVQKKIEYSIELLPYAFCLCLSYFGSPNLPKVAIKPRLLFEHLASLSLASYLGGKSLVLGTGRILEDNGTTLPVFARIINQLAEFIGEGDSFKNQKTLSRKDDGIDVVAIKLIDEFRASNLIVYGQCATGADWQSTGKLSQCQPEAFFDQWLAGHKVSTPLRSYFIPHVVQDEKFVWAARRAGLLFERLRVAKWAATSTALHSITSDMTKWVDAVLTRSHPLAS